MKKQRNKAISNLDMINFYVDEYKMLREESLQCLKNQNLSSTVTLTFMTLVAAIFEYQVKNINAGEKSIEIIVYSVIIPMLALTLFSLYLKEVLKIMKIARYLRKIEEEIHLCFIDENIISYNKHPFKWETEYMRTKNHTVVSPLLILFLYVMIAIVSMIYSIKYISYGIKNILICILVVGIAIIVGIQFIKMIRKELRGINRTLLFTAIKEND